jgi:hypothetical protein
VLKPGYGWRDPEIIVMSKFQKYIIFLDDYTDSLSIAVFACRGLFHNLKHESKMIGDMLSDVSIF